MVIHGYIELFYSSRRRHSYPGYKSPMEYNALFDEQAALAAKNNCPPNWRKASPPNRGKVMLILWIEGGCAHPNRKRF